VLFLVFEQFLFHEFNHKNGIGLAAIAGAGGIASALLVEKI